MTDTPEMTEWLDRIVIKHGKRATHKAFGRTISIGEARHLLYEDLGYDITRKQFEGLKDALDFELGIKEKQYRYRVFKGGKPTGQVHYRQVFVNKLGQFARKPSI